MDKTQCKIYTVNGCGTALSSAQVDKRSRSEVCDDDRPRSEDDDGDRSRSEDDDGES